MKCVFEYDRYEQQCDDLFGEMFDNLIEARMLQHVDLLKVGVHPKLHKYFLSDIMDDIAYIDRKMRIMRAQGDKVEHMRDVFEGWYTEYLDRFWWHHDPVKHSVPYIRPSTISCKTF